MGSDYNQTPKQNSLMVNLSGREGSEWRPDDHYPFQPSTNTPPRRSSRRQPSILDALKEEEVLLEAQPALQPTLKQETEFKIKTETTKHKRKKAPAKKCDLKKRRLAKSANRYAKNAREKTTIAWHKSCRTFLKSFIFCEICTHESSAESSMGSTRGPPRRAPSLLRKRSSTRI